MQTAALLSGYQFLHTERDCAKIHFDTVPCFHSTSYLFLFYVLVVEIIVYPPESQ